MTTEIVDNTTGLIAPSNVRDICETYAALPLSANSPVAGTTYTAVFADRGALIEFTSSSAITYTIPTNATIAFPVGTFLHIRSAGTGQVTITGPGGTGGTAGGVTIDLPTGTFTTRAQWSRVTAHKRATNEWVLEGDLS
jgi:hypothetical protein